MTQFKNVLIIDDDQDLRDALVEQFERHEGFSIETAPTAMEGVAKAETDKPDLIILDVELPDMDGRDACKLMRRHGVRAPIITVSPALKEPECIPTRPVVFRSPC